MMCGPTDTSEKSAAVVSLWLQPTNYSFDMIKNHWLRCHWSHLQTGDASPWNNVYIRFCSGQLDKLLDGPEKTENIYQQVFYIPFIE